jgi:hypothetical protein
MGIIGIFAYGINLAKLTRCNMLTLEPKKEGEVGRDAEPGSYRQIRRRLRNQ